MFDRSATDNARQMKTAVVEIKLDDGRALSGKVVFTSSSNLFDALNGQDAFIDFEPFDGQREFIAKSTLRAVRLIKTPPVPRLAGRGRDHDRNLGDDVRTGLVGHPRSVGDVPVALRMRTRPHR